MGPKGKEKRSMCLIPTIFPEVKEKRKCFTCYKSTIILHQIEELGYRDLYTDVKSVTKVVRNKR
jgi:hypothetical protein